MPLDRRQFIRRALAAGLGASLGWGAARAAAAAPAAGKKKILFDTDIGSDIDDAIALSYLLAQPRCELLGITTVTGEAMHRAEMASALCHVAGRPDIPIFPGAEETLAGPQLQPHAPQYAAIGNWPRETKFPRNEAVAFLRKTIRANPGEVTLLAVGPFTNVAKLFQADPEIPGLLQELVVMGGKFGPEPKAWGPTEWNARVDAEATAIVYDHAPARMRSYGLDVTYQVTLPRAEVSRRFADDRRLQLVLAFAQVWFAKQNKIYFHDPLAAVSTFEPEICGLERGDVTVELAAGPERGRTRWLPRSGGRHQVAMTVDAPRFFESYFKVFAG